MALTPDLNRVGQPLELLGQIEQPVPHMAEDMRTLCNLSELGSLFPV